MVTRILMMSPFTDVMVSRFNYELCASVSVRLSTTEALSDRLMAGGYTHS